jgi:hypothetical protein
MHSSTRVFGKVLAEYIGNRGVIILKCSEEDFVNLVFILFALETFFNHVWREFELAQSNEILPDELENLNIQVWELEL